jgi:hypothetical protein
LFAAFLISFPVNIVKKVLIFSVSAESWADRIVLFSITLSYNRSNVPPFISLFDGVDSHRDANRYPQR